jgi:formylglycine-generating enzyme required for sulfatase activity
MHPLRLAPALALIVLPLAAAAASGQGEGLHPEAARVPAARRGGTVVVPAGRYVPLYATGADAAGIDVAAFRLDVRPVTVAEFLGFVREAPGWQRGAAPPALADPAYLARWADALDPGPDVPPDRPATEVSWFAARAYCRWAGGRLPTTDEWEYAAQASETHPNAFRDPTFNRHTLGLVQGRAAPDARPPVGTTDRNVFGVHDLHGLVWEWTADFNNQVLTGSGRDDKGLDRGRFCAAGAVGTTDPGDYAAFLRWAFRTSLEGATTSPALGFRCAR